MADIIACSSCEREVIKEFGISCESAMAQREKQQNLELYYPLHYALL